MPNNAHNRSRLSPKVVLGALVGLFLLLCLIPLLAFVVWSRGHRLRVDAQLAKIAAAREPVSGADLATSFPLDSGAQDVTKIWMAGLDAIVEPDLTGVGKSIPFAGTGDWTGLPAHGADFPQFRLAQDHLTQNRLALEKFHEAGDRGGHGRFAVDFSNGYSTQLPYTQKQRAAARLLRLEFEIKCREGDAPGAAHSLKTLLVASRAVDHEPTLVSQLVAFAIDSVAMTALAEKLCLTPFAEEDLRAFRENIRSKSPAKNLRIGLLGERAMGYSTLQNPDLMGKDRPPLSPLASDSAAYLEFMSRHIAATREDFPEMLKQAQAAEDDLHKIVASPTQRMTMIYTSLMLPAMSAATEAAARNSAVLQAADAGIAIELYRREHGALPKTLAELTPKYLAAVPTDPRTSQPLFYVVTAEGFAIYGVGQNGVDDGGQFDKAQDAGLFFPVKP